MTLKFQYFSRYSPPDTHTWNYYEKSCLAMGREGMPVEAEYERYHQGGRAQNKELRR